MLALTGILLPTSQEIGAKNLFYLFFSSNFLSFLSFVSGSKMRAEFGPSKMIFYQFFLVAIGSFNSAEQSELLSEQKEPHSF